MADILSIQTPYQDQDTVTSDNLNDLVKKATFTSAVVDGATTQLSSGAIIVRDGGVTEQKLSTAAQAKLLKGAELEYPSPGDGCVGGDKTGNIRGSDSLDIQSKRGQLDEVASGDESVAIGLECTSSGGNSTALGFTAKATGEDATALGSMLTASGKNSVAVGSANNAKEEGATAVGFGNTVEGSINNAVYSSAFGYGNIVNDEKSIVAGFTNSTTGKSSVLIGDANTSGGDSTVAIGKFNVSNASDSIVIGYSNSATDSGGTKSVAIGYDNSVKGDTAVAFGANNIITGSGFSSAVGSNNTVSNTESHAFGRNILISSAYSVEFGIWGSATARQTAVKATYDGGVALTCENSASAPSDQATAGAEDIQQLGRDMFTIQRNGDAFTLYFNDGGTIKSLSLGTVS